jgi:hypothetical protein
MDPEVAIYGLLIKCPFNTEEKSCPLGFLRKKHVYERLDYKKQNEVKIQEFYKIHLLCFETRNKFISRKTGD